MSNGGHGPAPIVETITGAESTFRLVRRSRVWLEYSQQLRLFVEDIMAVLSKELLQSIAEVLARVPVESVDLASNVAQIGSQFDGLARLDDLDLLGVEPATVVLPPREAPHGR